MEMGGSSGSSESHFLKIGQKIYFEDANGGDDGKQEDGLSPVGGIKCVVFILRLLRLLLMGLNKGSVNSVAGICELVAFHKFTQSSVCRFHLLPEFDQGKRSCRRRLAGHNERRRKPTSGTLLSARYGSLPASIFGNNASSGGFLMDFSSCSRGRVHWPNTTTADKFPPLPWQGNLDNPPPYINPSVPPGTGFSGVQDSNCALSLLSNHSASRNQTASHDYYVNTDAGAHLPGYPGELGLGQQGGRRYDSSGDHIDWSL
ncbi:squamosa promoter-binding-like protein [Artemisia annua]|uniref:Squamosa promoter-binding-like protein n=1 Tax=Artemisia annua TaxID=35608 RepID=A0A2U1PMI3_ARTAN|nr:squamosa promoter-binding-like protein [Artemisia annua]